MTNENKINWTLVVLGTIICVGLYLIPSPFQSVRRVVVHTIDSTWVVLGTADTSGNNVPPVSGTGTSSVTATPTTTDSSTTGIYDFYFYNELQDSTKEGDKISIQTFVYPYEENDTIKAEIINNWQIQPRPIVTITRVDTVFKTIMVPKPVPFLEKPVVVSAVSVAVTLGIVYIVGQILR